MLVGYDGYTTATTVTRDFGTAWQTAPSVDVHLSIPGLKRRRRGEMASLGGEMNSGDTRLHKV